MSFANTFFFLIPFNKKREFSNKVANDSKEKSERI